MPDLTIGDYEIDEDSNGDLVIKDTNDNIVMRWDSGNGNWNFESQTLTNLGSLSTDGADVTAESFVDAKLSGNISASAGVYETIVDTEIEDVNGEFSAGTFTPASDGYYEIRAIARVNNFGDGDQFIMRLRDVSNNFNIVLDYTQAAGTGRETIQLFAMVPLNGSRDYEVQLQNEDSLFTIESGDSITRVTVKKSIVHK